MQARVTAGSRHNHLVLYDRTALPRDLPLDPDLESQEPKPLSTSAAQDIASRGEALIFHIPGEDCDATLGLFVDEDPPAAIVERATPVLSGARLSAPSGILTADGLEFMTRPGEDRKYSEPDVVAVPAGEYEVDVRELLSWKVRHRAEAVRRGSRASERWAHKLVTVYALLTMALIAANFLMLPGLGVLWQRRGFRTALQVAAVTLIIDVVVFGGFWILDSARKRFPALSRISEAEAAFDLENPDIAVILRLQSGALRGGAPAFAKIRLPNAMRR